MTALWLASLHDDFADFAERATRHGGDEFARLAARWRELADEAAQRLTLDDIADAIAKDAVAPEPWQ